MAGRRQRWTAVAVAGFLVVIVDQAVKALVLTVLGETVEVTPGLALRLSYNTGAAFSTGTSLTPLITSIAVVVLAAIVWSAPRVTAAGWALAVGLVGGGAAGNLIDRLFRAPGVGRGAVVDYIDVSWFAAFNLADVAITAGAVLAILLSWRGVPALRPRGSGAESLDG